MLEMLKNESLTPCNICFRLEFCHLDTCNKITSSIKNKLYNIFEKKDFKFNLLYFQDIRDVKQLYTLFNMLKNKSFLLLSEIKKLMVLLLELANIDEFQYISNNFIKSVSEENQAEIKLNVKNSVKSKSKLGLISLNVKNYIMEILKLNEVVITGFDKLTKEVSLNYNKLITDSISNNSTDDNYSIEGNNESKNLKLTKMLRLKSFKQYVNSLKKLRKKVKNLELLYEIIVKLMESLYKEIIKNSDSNSNLY